MKVSKEDRKRLAKAKALSKSEQLVNDIMDGQYSQRSTDNKGDAPIGANPFMEF